MTREAFDPLARLPTGLPRLTLNQNYWRRYLWAAVVYWGVGLGIWEGLGYAATVIYIGVTAVLILGGRFCFAVYRGWKG